MPKYGPYNTLTNLGIDNLGGSRKKFSPEPVSYLCWVAGDKSRCFSFTALTVEAAEQQAAKHFGVSETRIMSRRET